MSGVTSPTLPPVDDPEFTSERSRLLGVAYRITGSRSDAEDIVQDAWLRWERTDRGTIDRPAAWLTTVTSRLALDRLKSAQRTREDYVGPWLPEMTTTEADPAERAELAESLTVGFLTVLERLGPVERVVFLLADVFGHRFDEIASVVDKSPEACRQIASRARRRVQEGRPRYEPTDDDAWQATKAFLDAAHAGDVDTLLALLSEGAVLVSDGGADHHAARRPIVRERIPRFVVNITKRREAVLGPDHTVEATLVNGQPSLVIRERGVPTFAMSFDVVDQKIEGIYVVLNPDKLAALDTDPIA
jgi:RNA polymerase sigma-70 factor, ECF subfamily